MTGVVRGPIGVVVGGAYNGQLVEGRALERGQLMYDVKRAADDGGWIALDFPGVEMKVLHTELGSGATIVLTRLAAGAVIPRHRHTVADETVYVVERDFVEDNEAFGPGSFFAGKAGTDHGPHSSMRGCVVLTRFSGPLDFVLAG
jgi:anti-sigma factor ChrR (cupin superfamily)